MSELLDGQYLTWLYGQVADIKEKNPARTYWSVCRQLYKKEFVWLFANDDNRIEDGRELRYEFIDSYDIEEVDPEWLSMGCSMLELLVGLSRRLSFDAEGEPREWFWQMLENLDLDLSRIHDRRFNTLREWEIDQALDQVIWRTYSADGHGGLFPLRGADRDQREIEIWYQASAYIMERY